MKGACQKGISIPIQYIKEPLLEGSMPLPPHKHPFFDIGLFIISSFMSRPLSLKSWLTCIYLIRNIYLRRRTESMNNNSQNNNKDK